MANVLVITKVIYYFVIRRKLHLCTTELACPSGHQIGLMFREMILKGDDRDNCIEEGTVSETSSHVL